MTRPADWLPSYRLADYEREIAAATHGANQGGTPPDARPPASGGDLTSYQSGDRLAAWLNRHAHRVEWACFGGVMLMLCIMGAVILTGVM